MPNTMLTGKNHTECVDVGALGFLVSLFELGESIAHERLPSCSFSLQIGYVISSRSMQLRQMMTRGVPCHP
jgi:hypothetical protein